MQDQNQQYDYPPPPGPTGPPSSPPGNGMAIASLVLGIISILFFWTSIFAIIFMVTSIIGIVLGVLSRKKNSLAGFPTGLGTAGLVLNIIALIFTSLSFIFCGICITCAILADPLFLDSIFTF